MLVNSLTLPEHAEEGSICDDPAWHGHIFEGNMIVVCVVYGMDTSLTVHSDHDGLALTHIEYSGLSSLTQWHIHVHDMNTELSIGHGYILSVVV